jgi:hypothetical protein
MSERTTRRVALAVVVFTAALMLANVVLLVLGREALTNDDGDLLFGVVAAIGGVLYVAIGLLIAVRARNVIGWLLALVGISYGLLTFGNAYAAVGLVTDPGSLPAAEEVSTALSQLWMVALVALVLVLLLFPDGRPPSRRWRPIYPPLLADQGLVVALEGQARKAALPVEVEGEGIVRYPHPQEVEAAVYFCCLEALQNVAKYANASSARVQLADRDGTVTFEVVDDGTGFDPEHTPLGTGLEGMRDRLEALGGTLMIDSIPDRGTTVGGTIRAGA